MTEYWVSQGNKWCDFCKIFISNNPGSIRNHELGERHKDAVAKRLADMRKDKAAKEKQLQEAAKAIQQIEAKAQRSYQKDVATFKETRDSNAQALDIGDDGDERWKFDSSSGYYYDQGTGLCYDPNSGFYYSDAIGKWVTQQEAYASSTPVPADPKSKAPIVGKAVSLSRGSQEKIGNSMLQKEKPPGPVVSGSVNPKRSAKGAAPSSLAVKKKRIEKPKVITKEEQAALKAREAAKKRVQEREKPLLGLYRPQL